jgi:hypothetical protein
VLTQPTDSEERLVDFEKRYREYVPASFVRWLESGGARVIPIQYAVPPLSPSFACFITINNNLTRPLHDHSYDTDEQELRHLFESINGVLFTGGEITDISYGSPHSLCVCVALLSHAVLCV